MQDAIFNLYAIQEAENISYYEKYIYHYRKNDKSICNRYSVNTINYAEKFMYESKKFINKYNKNELYKKALEIRKIKFIDTYMYNYYFHKDNKKSYEIIKEEIQKLLNNTFYKKAIKTVKYKELNIYIKILLFFLKKNDIDKIYKLVKLKEKTKKIQGKKVEKVVP